MGFFYWWLVKNHLSGCFYLFAPKCWKRVRDLKIIFCLSVGGNTHLNFLHSEVVGMLKHCSRTQAT